jgi:hypothetical protein
MKPVAACEMVLRRQGWGPLVVSKGLVEHYGSINIGDFIDKLNDI